MRGIDQVLVHVHDAEIETSEGSETPLITGDTLADAPDRPTDRLRWKKLPDGVHLSNVVTFPKKIA
jgi:hypothetical protein